VRYRVALDALPPAYACHCRDCQTWSGSAFSLQVIVAEDRLEVGGETALFALPSPDGTRLSRQHACPVCFTRLYNSNTGRPGLLMVRAGTLDRSGELAIVAHIWTTRALPGVLIPPGIPAWPESAPAAALIALVIPAPDGD
jgi:hypothetical protein